MSESDVQEKIQIISPYYGTLQRNNSGAFKDATGRWVRYGLHNVSKKQNSILKSSDLIGITIVTVTPEMIGQKLAVYTAVEVKKPGWRYNPKDKKEVAQKNYINWIKNMFGYAGFAQSIDDYLKIIGVK